MTSRELIEQEQNCPDCTAALNEEMILTRDKLENISDNNNTREGEIPLVQKANAEHNDSPNINDELPGIVKDQLERTKKVSKLYLSCSKINKKLHE